MSEAQSSENFAVNKPNVAVKTTSASSSPQSSNDKPSDKVKELQKAVQELTAQNKFLKKKNHELTFRLMQLEREKNDRIRLQEAEEWYSNFCQRTKYPAPTGNAAPRHMPPTQPNMNAPPTHPQHSVQNSGEFKFNGHFELENQPKTSQSPSPVPSATSGQMQDPTKSAAFLSVYQNVYNQLAAAFPYAEAQAISYNAQMRTISILQQQQNTTNTNLPQSASTTTDHSDDSEGDQFGNSVPKTTTKVKPSSTPSALISEWTSTEGPTMHDPNIIDDGERSAMSSFESVFSNSGVFSASKFNGANSNSNRNGSFSSMNGGWGASTSNGAVWN